MLNPSYLTHSDQHLEIQQKNSTLKRILILSQSQNSTTSKNKDNIESKLAALKAKLNNNLSFNYSP